MILCSVNTTTHMCTHTCPQRYTNTAPPQDEVPVPQPGTQGSSWLFWTAAVTACSLHYMGSQFPSLSFWLNFSPLPAILLPSCPCSDLQLVHENPGRCHILHEALQALWRSTAPFSHSCGLHLTGNISEPLCHTCKAMLKYQPQQVSLWDLSEVKHKAPSGDSKASRMLTGSEPFVWIVTVSKGGRVGTYSVSSMGRSYVQFIFASPRVEDSKRLLTWGEHGNK